MGTFDCLIGVFDASLKECSVIVVSFRAPDPRGAWVQAVNWEAKKNREQDRYTYTARQVGASGVYDEFLAE